MKTIRLLLWLRCPVLAAVLLRIELERLTLKRPITTAPGKPKGLKSALLTLHIHGIVDKSELKALRKACDVGNAACHGAKVKRSRVASAFVGAKPVLRKLEVTV